MTDLKELYQQVILDHNKSPHNFREVEGANRTAEGYNPLCGDQLALSLKLDEGNVIRDVGFTGQGCAISKASASLMTDAVKGKTLKEAEDLFEKFHSLLTGPSDVKAGPEAKDLGKLVVFAGVREFPVRVKCATLAWHTLHNALEGQPQVATTE